MTYTPCLYTLPAVGFVLTFTHPEADISPIDGVDWWWGKVRRHDSSLDGEGRLSIEYAGGLALPISLEIVVKLE